MNNTPQAIRPLEALASRAISGVEELGAVINIKANDLPTMEAAVYNLFGRKADPAATPPVVAVAGKQPLYAEAKIQHARARAERRQAEIDGYDFVAKAVNLLKGELGRRWNAEWAAIGFNTPSLSLPRDPLPILTMLSGYFEDHPDHEVESMDITSAQAELMKVALVSTRAAADSTRVTEATAKQERDEAMRKVRSRIGALREELDSLLTADDPRWYRFGFRRPADGETPDLVEEVRLTPGTPGNVIVEWNHARLADNYRVSWKLASAAPEEEPTEVGLFADQMAMISGLSSGVTIKVSVTARNASGESAPMEAAIVVP